MRKTDEKTDGRRFKHRDSQTSEKQPDFYCGDSIAEELIKIDKIKGYFFIKPNGFNFFLSSW